MLLLINEVKRTKGRARNHRAKLPHRSATHCNTLKQQRFADFSPTALSLCFAAFGLQKDIRTRKQARTGAQRASQIIFCHIGSITRYKLPVATKMVQMQNPLLMFLKTI